jgi:hypothetical protein
MTDSEAKDFMSKSRPISRLNWPTQEQLLAARRERGLVLRAMIASIARRVSLAFASHRKQRNDFTDKSPVERARPL